MVNEQLIKSTLTLDGRQPAKVLEDLGKKAKKLEGDISKALSSGDNKALKASYAEWKKNEAEIARVKNGIFDVKKVLDSISTASLKDLRKAKMQINQELDKMTRGTEEYIAKSKQLKAVNTELKNVANSTNDISKNNESMFGKMSNGFNKYFGLVAGIGAAFTGVVFSARKAVDAFNEYEETVDNLGAITGLAGEELNWLSEKAKEMSTSTVEGSIKIKQSAVDIVDAYKTMGSDRPELLKNKEDLAAVTQEALILAEASKMETAPAIDAVAASMNQFGLDADQARRIINTLAAGSLEGSAEVADLTESLKNAGTVADGANMTLEMTVGALEVLGEKQLKGAEAGTKLRGAILKMKEAGVGYVSGAFNMRDALVEVQAKLEAQGSEMEKDALRQKLFGIENQTVGTILVDNIDKFDKLTKAVTGTDTAIVQATKNTQNNAAELAQAKNRASLLAIELGEKLAPAMTFSTNVFTKFLKVIVGSIEFYQDHKTAINSVIVGLTTYTVIVKGADMWTAIWTNGIKKAIDAMKGLNKVSSASIWGAVAGAIAIAVTYLMQYETVASRIKDTQNELNKRMAKSSAEFETLKDAILKANIGSAERKKLIDQMNSQYGEYLTNQISEKDNNNQIAASLEGVNNALMRNEISKMQLEKTSEIRGKITEKQIDRIKMENQLLEVQQRLLKGGYSTIGAKASDITQEINLSNAIDKVKESESKLKLELDETNKIFEQVATQYAEEISDSEKIAKILRDRANAREEEAKAAENASKNNNVNSDEYQKALDERNKSLKETLEKDKQDEYEYQLWYENLLATNAINQQIKDEEEKKKKEELEKKHQEDILNIRKQYGLVSDEELQTLEIETLTAFYDQKLLNEEEFQTALAAIKKKYADKETQNVNDNLVKERQKRLENVQMASQIIGYGVSIISDLRDAELAKYEGNEEKQKQIRKKYADKEFAIKAAEIVANTAAAVMQININPAVNADITQTLRTLLTGMIVAQGLVQLGIANSSRQKVSQLASGQYDVIGEQTGKSYSANYIGSVKTGYYPKPTLALMGEEGPEIVTDGQTTRNLILHYPEALQAISYARAGVVPQHASGYNMPAPSSSQNVIVQIDPYLANAMNTFAKALQKPISAEVSLKQFIEKDLEYNAIISDVSIGS